MRFARLCLGLTLAVSVAARADDLAAAAASLGRDLGRAMAKAQQKPAGFSAPGAAVRPRALAGSFFVEHDLVRPAFLRSFDQK